MPAERSQDSGRLPSRIQEALGSLHSYLSDEIPPLFFVDSLQQLFGAPPQIVAAQIISWATGQFSPSGQLPTADYIFHGAKKIHLLAELELFPEEAINEFVSGLRPELLAGCPAADRASLGADLDRLDLAGGVGSVGGVEVVYQRSVGVNERKTRSRADDFGELVDGPELTKMSRSFAQGLKKLDFLLNNVQMRLTAGNTDSSVPDAGTIDRLTGEIVTQASTWVRSSEEMERLLAELGKRGLPVSFNRVLALLAERLPDWAPPSPESLDREGSPQAAVRAMGHFVSMAPDQGVRQDRYSELVDTGVGEFNNSSLGRAVTVLDLATSMAEQGEVDSLFADSVQRQAYGKLDQKLLHKFAEENEYRQLLRRLLGFFQLLSAKELLGQLDGEPDRNKRKFLLDLLRVHESDARLGALSELAEAHTGSKFFHWHYVRNLVHLLRTIPRDPAIPVDNELDVLTPLTGLENELPLIREALAIFSQLPHERAVTTLAARVNEVEQILQSDEQHSLTPDQLISLLDSMIKSLAKVPTSAARRYVVAHALKRNAKLGNTLERMTWLSDQDLSGEKDIVSRLIADIRNELPRGLLGFSRKSEKKQQVLVAMVRTLASTTSPEVRKLFLEIKNKHKDLPAIATVAEILSRAEESRPERQEKEPTLSGDLALFGLPNLLQNLAESQISGLLKILGSGGGITARVWMEEGLVLAAEAGLLRGEVAVYQLLENPAPGQFVFGESDEEPDPKAKANQPTSVQAVLFEGIRRYDEFNRAAAVVPDDTILSSTGAKPTPPEGETDGDLVRQVWLRASSGYSPVDCEVEVAVDRFRIRCLYEHWVTEGSLAVAETSGPAS